eukprot:g7966.t1
MKRELMLSTSTTGSGIAKERPLHNFVFLRDVLQAERVFVQFAVDLDRSGGRLDPREEGGRCGARDPAANLSTRWSHFLRGDRSLVLEEVLVEK